MIYHVTPEERNALMNILDTNSRDGNTKIIMAIFRDIYIFKQMSQSLLLRYEDKVKELEERIERLEERILELEK